MFAYEHIRETEDAQEKQDYHDALTRNIAGAMGAKIG